MKVEELIDKLKEFDEELEVRIFETEFNDFMPIRCVSLYDFDGKPEDNFIGIEVQI